jgi:hypothetical protein
MADNNDRWDVVDYTYILKYDNQRDSHLRALKG